MSIRSYRIGKRGVFLALFGIVYILTGKSLIDTPNSPVVQHVFRFALHVMPLTGYGIAWIACGVTALAYGLIPNRRDTLGFAAASFMPTAWAFVYFTAWLQLDVPGVQDLLESTVTFALLAAAVAIVAGMPEPGELTRLSGPAE